MSNTVRIEQRSLKLSMFGTLFFVLLGLGFAVLTNSSAILFDGIYSLIVFSISLLTLRVARLSKRPDDETFNFGYKQLEPMLNMFKSLFVIAACLFAAISAAGRLGEGGKEMDYAMALIYGILSCIGCFAVGIYLKKAGRESKSSLVRLDAAAWFVDGMLSASVMIGFAIAIFLETSQWASWAPYVDPLLVLVLTILALPVPAKFLLESLREALNMAPEKSIVDTLDSQLRASLEQVAMDDLWMRVLKHGNSIYLLTHVLVGEGFGKKDVFELDAIRSNSLNYLCQQNPDADLDMDMLFIGSDKWAYS